MEDPVLERRLEMYSQGSEKCEERVEGCPAKYQQLIEREQGLCDYPVGCKVLRR
jgi:hypothetical protein